MPKEALVVLANIVAIIVMGIAVVRLRQYDPPQHEQDENGP
ncbi:hypothetical protein [Ralstonia mannitolilytica]